MDAPNQQPDGSGGMGGWWPGGAGARIWSPSFLLHIGLKAGWTSPGGPHPGVTNVLLADGSTRGVSDTIDYATWYYICAMKDRQTIGDF